MEKLEIEHALIGAICLSIIVRLYFILTIPLFDNDSIVNLLFAKNFSTHGIVPKTNTLVALLIGTGFILFEENILVGRLIELLAAIATTYLSYKMGARFFDKRTGLFAAFFVSYIPLHIFYSTISKVYCVLGLFVLLSIYTFLIGFLERKPLFCLSSAIFLFMAFLCKTFAAIGIIPIVVIFFADIINKKCDKRKTATTMKLVGTPILLFAFLVVLNALWKVPEFGISFYRDAPMDFLSTISSQYFPRPWYSLTAFNSITPFTLLPLIMLSIIIKREGIGVVNRVIFVFISVNIMVVILNPLNHAPRGLMPSIPLLCVIAGAALARLMDTANSSPSNLSRLLALSSVAITFVVFYFLKHKIGRLYFFEMNSLQTIFASFAFIIVCFFILQFMFSQIIKNIKVDLFQKKKLLYLIITPFLLSHAIFGIALSAQKLGHHAKVSYPVFDAVSFAPSCRILGGEDFVNLFDGTSFPMISDLPMEDVRKIISGEVISVFEKHEINNIIISRNVSVLDEMLLKGMGKTLGIPNPKHRQAIYSSKEISRIFDNGKASLYNYNPLLPVTCNKSDALRNYVVPYQMNMGGTKLYLLDTPPFETILSFCIENNNTSSRQYSVRVAEISLVDIETVNFDRNTKLLFSKRTTIERSSKKEMNIHLNRYMKQRIGVQVRDMTEGVDYYIYW